jgi:type IV secretory pathway TraG/TraD family ATPase VirD4
MAKLLATLWSLACLLLGIWIAWRWSEPLGLWLAPLLGVHFGSYLLNQWTVGIAVVLLFGWLGGCTGRVFLRPVRRKTSSTSTLRRWVIGRMANAGVFLLAELPLVLVALYGGLVVFFLAAPDYPLRITPEKLLLVFLMTYLLCEFVFPCIWGFSAATRAFLGRLSAPVRRELTRWRAGLGGSARFAGLLDEWGLRYRKGDIFAGASLYDRSWPVGIRDDRHILTIAANGGGKGRTAIIPNLLLWTGSAIVVDPKGTNAAVTAAARGHGGGRVKKGMGQDVYALNPFGVNAGQPGMPPAARFNPLSVIDPDSPTLYEDIDLIAESIVVPGKGDSLFWDSSARNLLVGLIAYVRSEYGTAASLPLVRQLLTRPGGPPLADMIKDVSTPLGKIAAESVSQLSAASRTGEGSGILSTAINHTKWLASEAMQDTLSASDFDFFALKEKPTTIILILPPEYLDTHNRFLRLFVNLAIKASTQGGKAQQPILFLMDEFYALGRMDSLAKGAALLRSYGVKLWPILQNISQLQELYPENWEGFLANAGHVQVFSANDLATQNYISNKLGKSVVYQKDAQGHPVPVAYPPLRDPAEVAAELGRKGTRQIILREGGSPLVLRRRNYDNMFPKHCYNPDPDHPEGEGLVSRLSSLAVRAGAARGAIALHGVRALFYLLRDIKERAGYVFSELFALMRTFLERRNRKTD